MSDPPRTLACGPSCLLCACTTTGVKRRAARRASRVGFMVPRMGWQCGGCSGTCSLYIAAGERTWPHSWGRIPFMAGHCPPIVHSPTKSYWRSHGCPTAASAKLWLNLACAALRHTASHTQRRLCRLDKEGLPMQLANHRVARTWRRRMEGPCDPRPTQLGNRCDALAAWRPGDWCSASVKNLRR